jgi:hypothetical protein
VSGLRGVVVGVGGLVLLEVVVTNRNGEAGRVGGVIDTVSKGLTAWLDPYTPLIPDLSKGAASPFGPDPSSGAPKVEANAYSVPTTPRRLPATPQPAISV